MRAVVLGSCHRFSVVLQCSLLGVAFRVFLLFQCFTQVEAVMSWPQVSQVLLLHLYTGVRLHDVRKLFEFIKFNRYIESLSVKPNHGWPDVLFSWSFLHVLGQCLLVLVATNTKVALQRFSSGFQILIVLEQKWGVDGCFRLILVAIWRHARVLMSLQTISRLAETVHVFDVDLLGQSLLVVQQVEVLLSVVYKKGDASLLFEWALLHIQSHCHFYDVDGYC